MTDISTINPHTNIFLLQKQNAVNIKKQDIIIKVDDLKKVYRVGKQPVFALNGVSFEI